MLPRPWRRTQRSGFEDENTVTEWPWPRLMFYNNILSFPLMVRNITPPSCTRTRAVCTRIRSVITRCNACIFFCCALIFYCPMTSMCPCSSLIDRWKETAGGRCRQHDQNNLIQVGIVSLFHLTLLWVCDVRRMLSPQFCSWLVADEPSGVMEYSRLHDPDFQVF